MRVFLYESDSKGYSRQVREIRPVTLKLELLRRYGTSSHRRVASPKYYNGYRTYDIVTPELVGWLTYE